MRRPTLPINALPAWSKLNDVNFLDINVQDLGSEKGYGLVTSRALNSEDVYDVPTLMNVPHDLILSAEAIEEHAKVDPHFKELLDAFGRKTHRSDVMLFLLMQITIASNPDDKAIGLSNPWTEYVRLLPDAIPIPTLWSEEERLLLVGTSLESAVAAKYSHLVREYELLQKSTQDRPWCTKAWWEGEGLDLKDWILLDAWYRSRCLEVPNIGEVMIPCIDMVNHSLEANSYYEPTADGVALLLRPGVKLDTGEEITISYGNAKSEAEMLFSYGFIDDGSGVRGITLDLRPVPDDPLGKAKAAAFPEAPVVQINDQEGVVRWDSAFVYFMCLNEEDGLEFRVLQQTDGSRQLMVFWQGLDVTDSTDKFESHITDHDLEDVFKLRAVALLEGRITEQLERLLESKDMVETLVGTTSITPHRQGNAMQLRRSENTLLERLYGVLVMQKNELLESEVVLKYLGSMNDEGRPDQVSIGNEEEDDDFS